MLLNRLNRTGPCNTGAFRSGPAPQPQRRPLRLVVVSAAVVSSNDFRNGTAVEIEGVPYKVIYPLSLIHAIGADAAPSAGTQVTEFLHVKPGKGSAFVRTKLKNFLNGTVVEKTFRAGETVNAADISTREGQFTYTEGEEYVFMDQQTYEETRLKKDDWAEFLKEGTVCQLMFFNGKVIAVDPPMQMDLIVTECPPNVKGNTASGSGSKPATLETGAQVTVPLFIEPGTKIKVDTRTRQYLSKVN